MRKSGRSTSSPPNSADISSSTSSRAASSLQRSTRRESASARLFSEPAQEHGEQCAECSDRQHGDEEAQPVVEAPPHDGHVADEGAQHQQVALGEIDQLGRLVDEHESQSDQAVNTADCQPIEGKLQENNQFPSPANGRSIATSSL